MAWLPARGRHIWHEQDRREKLGPGRVAIAASDRVQAVHRGPMQVRLIPPSGAFDGGELLDTIASLRVHVASMYSKGLGRRSLPAELMGPPPPTKTPSPRSTAIPARSGMSWATSSPRRS